MPGTLFDYTGVDGLTPLKAEARYPEGTGALPLVVVMHGYSGGIEPVLPELDWLAQRGVFGAAVSMRGRDGSAGDIDSGGLEILDIYSCVQHLLATHPEQIDPGNINIWGYSGGGGNALSCAVRFPELFHQVAAFFGITDYAHWYHSGAYTDMVGGWVGGSPEQMPWAYASRRSRSGVGNNRLGNIHLFWDEDEQICDKRMDEDYVQAAEDLGLTNVTAHLSLRTQSAQRRFIHGYPTGSPGVRYAQEEILLPELFAPRDPQRLAIAPHGRLEVTGYLLTRQFGLWIGDGTGGLMTADYELDGHSWRFELEPQVVRPEARARIVPSLHPREVLLNDKPVAAERLDSLPLPCVVDLLL